MVGTQKAQHDAGEQQAGGVADAEAEGAELEAHHADHQTYDKKAQKASRSVT